MKPKNKFMFPRWIAIIPLIIMCGLLGPSFCERKEPVKTGNGVINAEDPCQAAELFRLSFAAEQQFNPSLDMKSSQSWKGLEASLAACADKIALYHQRETRLRYFALGLFWLSIFLSVYRSEQISKASNEASVIDKPPSEDSSV